MKHSTQVAIDDDCAVALPVGNGFVVKPERVATRKPSEIGFMLCRACTWHEVYFADVLISDSCGVPGHASGSKGGRQAIP